MASPIHIFVNEDGILCSEERKLIQVLVNSGDVGEVTDVDKEVKQQESQFGKYVNALCKIDEEHGSSGDYFIASSQ